jgi:DNA-binding transcriptional LysR family regulator
MSLAGAARLLGVSTSAISRVLHRIAQEKSE